MADEGFEGVEINDEILTGGGGWNVEPEEPVAQLPDEATGQEAEAAAPPASWSKKRYVAFAVGSALLLAMVVGLGAGLGSRGAASESAVVSASNMQSMTLEKCEAMGFFVEDEEDEDEDEWKIVMEKSVAKAARRFSNDLSSEDGADNWSLDSHDGNFIRRRELRGMGGRAKGEPRDASAKQRNLSEECEELVAATRDGNN